MDGLGMQSTSSQRRTGDSSRRFRRVEGDLVGACSVGTGRQIGGSNGVCVMILMKGFSKSRLERRVMVPERHLCEISVTVKQPENLREKAPRVSR